MKTKMMTLAAVLCCIFAFTACQKPDNDADKGGDEKREESQLDDPSAAIAKVVVEYKFHTTDDLLKFFDFNLEYIDVKSDSKLTEKVSTTEFKKEFSDASLPLNMGYKLTTTLKEGVTIDKLKAEGTMNYLLPFPTVWISMYDKDNKLIGDGGVRNTASVIPMSGKKVAERFEAGSFNKSYYESVNEKGSGTTGTWK